MTVVILGAGIGGLSTAYYLLKKQAQKIILLEASNRVGGWIRSDHFESGVILEQTEFVQYCLVPQLRRTDLYTLMVNYTRYLPVSNRYSAVSHHSPSLWPDR